MIVLDASAVLELVLSTPRGTRVAARIAGDGSLHGRLTRAPGHRAAIEWIR